MKTLIAFLCLVVAGCAADDPRARAEKMLETNYKTIEAETRALNMSITANNGEAAIHQQRIDSLLRVNDSLLQQLSK